MIVKPLQNEYDAEIYECIKNDIRYIELSEGEKAILFDLAQYVKKYVCFSWSKVSIPTFIYNCYKGYMKCKGGTILQVTCSCINHCFPNKKARIEQDYTNDIKRLIVEDKPTKGKKREEN